MLNNKRITMALSVLLAIGLWAYVVGGIDPNTTELYKGVPITFLNEEALAAEELAVLSVSDETMDIRLAGQRAAVSKVDKEDITATVDLADVTAGEHVIKININVKSSDEVEIDDKSISRVTVVIEEAVSQSKPVRVSFVGEYTQGEEPTAIDVSRNNVTVTGAKSLVDKVDHVQATVDATKVTTDMKSFRASLTAVDAHGIRIDKVRLSSETSYVTAVLWQTKTVPLTVPIAGQDSGEAERTVSAPKTITIKGRADTLAQIEGITAQIIDLSEVMTSQNVAIIPILPDGVEVAHNSDGLVLEVTVKGYESKTFTYSGEDISITGEEEGQQIRVTTETVEVTITGKADVISKIEEEDITLHASVADLGEGNHRVAIRLSCDADYSRLTASPTNIRVSIE